jgi:hypothetical protein
MAAFLFILGGVSSAPGYLNPSEKSFMVASIMQFQFFYNLSWAPA